VQPYHQVGATSPEVLQQTELREGRFAKPQDGVDMRMMLRHRGAAMMRSNNNLCSRVGAMQALDCRRIYKRIADPSAAKD
jgi:hypothetical protein